MLSLRAGLLFGKINIPAHFTFQALTIRVTLLLANQPKVDDGLLAKRSGKLNDAEGEFKQWCYLIARSGLEFTDTTTDLFEKTKRFLTAR